MFNRIGCYLFYVKFNFMSKFRNVIRNDVNDERNGIRIRLQQFVNLIYVCSAHWYRWTELFVLSIVSLEYARPRQTNYWNDQKNKFYFSTAAISMKKMTPPGEICFLESDSKGNWFSVFLRIVDSNAQVKNPLGRR